MSNIFDKAGAFLATAAPSLATIFGGPLAGTAVSGIESILGIQPNAQSTIDQRKESAALAMLSATPEQVIQLKTLGDNLQKQFLDAGVTMEQTDESDRNSARTREEQVKDWLPSFLAILITIGFFGLLGLMCFHEMPTASSDTIKIMVGALGAGWASVVSYYYGSSSGAARAQELLAKTSTTTD